MISKEELNRAFDSRFPPEVKDKLSAARVAIAGLGGLGSNIALMLARTGIGKLLLVDFDTVDTTNLNRQAYGISQLGKAKTEAMLELIAEINPFLEVEVRQIRVTPENAVGLFGEYPILCEAFDQPEQKAMLISTVLSQCPNTIIVSGNGMAGYGDSNAITTRRRMERLYVCGDGTTDICSGIGLMAPRVSICAGHQANKVIQLILR